MYKLGLRRDREVTHFKPLWVSICESFYSELPTGTLLLEIYYKCKWKNAVIKYYWDYGMILVIKRTFLTGKGKMETNTEIVVFWGPFNDIYMYRNVQYRLKVLTHCAAAKPCPCRRVKLRHAASLPRQDWGVDLQFGRGRTMTNGSIVSGSTV